MFKRAFDITAVCLGLIFVIPLMIIIAILVKITSSGPVFFRQRRVGLNEKIFSVYKFRTMVQNADKMGTSVTTRNDPRITRIGRFLRKTKSDELPQLINVLKGDMSLVGPRPDVPEIIQSYTPEMKKIFKIRPGITSVATLHLRDEEAILTKVNNPDEFYEKIIIPLKVNLAMQHVDKNSFTFDLKILCKTMWILTFGRWMPITEPPEIIKLRRAI